MRCVTCVLLIFVISIEMSAIQRRQLMDNEPIRDLSLKPFEVSRNRILVNDRMGELEGGNATASGIDDGIMSDSATATTVTPPLSSTTTASTTTNELDAAILDVFGGN